jgi:hypothetical protein
MTWKIPPSANQHPGSRKVVGVIFYSVEKNCLMGAQHTPLIERHLVNGVNRIFSGSAALTALDGRFGLPSIGVEDMIIEIKSPISLRRSAPKKSTKPQATFKEEKETTKRVKERLRRKLSDKLIDLGLRIEGESK